MTPVEQLVYVAKFAKRRGNLHGPNGQGPGMISAFLKILRTVSAVTEAVNITDTTVGALDERPIFQNQGNTGGQ